MDYSIVEKEAFRLVGVKRRVPIVFEGQNPEIMKMVQSLTASQREELAAMRNTDVQTVVNASFNFDEGRSAEKGELDHMIGSITTLDRNFAGFDVEQVAAGSWAVFEMEGPFPEKLQNTWGRIFSEWLPSSGFELVEGPEITFNGDMSDFTKVYSEIWIPVKKQASRK